MTPKTDSVAVLRDDDVGTLARICNELLQKCHSGGEDCEICKVQQAALKRAMAALSAQPIGYMDPAAEFLLPKPDGCVLSSHIDLLLVRDPYGRFTQPLYLHPAAQASAPPEQAGMVQCTFCRRWSNLSSSRMLQEVPAEQASAPGEVGESDPFKRIPGLHGIADAADYLARNPGDEYATRRLRERLDAFAEMHGLAARAPSAQGDAVAWQRKHEFGNWHDVSREVYELAQREPALRRGYEFRALYTSAPAAGDGDAKLRRTGK